MAGNAKTRAKKDAAAKKHDAWWTKFRIDTKKILDTGDLPRHFVPRGQAFTSGKKS